MDRKHIKRLLLARDEFPPWEAGRSALFEDPKIVEPRKFFHRRNGLADCEAIQHETSIQRSQARTRSLARDANGITAEIAREMRFTQFDHFRRVPDFHDRLPPEIADR